MLATKENHTWMIEEKEEEKVEALETMELVDGEPTKTIRVGRSEEHTSELQSQWGLIHNN